MTTERARSLARIRVAVQAAFLALFVFLFLRSGDAAAPSLASRGFFFALDPLFLLLDFLGTGRILPLALLSLVPLILTFLLGRFFCGWVCPLGTIHHFFSYALNRNPNGAGEGNRRLRRLKYLILVAVIVAAAAGTQIGGWLDPISLLTRSAASAIVPAAARLVTGGTEAARVSLQPVLIGALFVVPIALNAFRRRFFCNALCPLGALYGLAARFSLLDIRPGADCRSCRTCAGDCPAERDPRRRESRSDCLTCLNCAAECPQGAVAVGLALPGGGPATSIDVGRRRLIGSAALGIAAAALPKASIQARPGNSRRFLRPPGSSSENAFLDRCMRCGQCAQACPTNFIQPALLEAGFEGLWTPILNAQAGFCDYECRRCTLVCPSEAIGPLTLDQKKRFKIGTALVEKSRCYTYADGFNCTKCAEGCPLPDKAIRFREAQTWDFRGKRVTVNQIYVVPDLCTGCGICEHVCPRREAPGIVVTAEDEVRESPAA